MPRISKPELIKLQKKLGTDAAIGEKIGITRQAVHQIRQAYGIPAIVPDFTGRNQKIIALHKKGLSGAAVSNKIGLSIAQVNLIIRNAGAGKRKPARKTPGRKKGK